MTASYHSFTPLVPCKDAEFSLHQGRNYGGLQRSARRPTRPPTSIALDDNFDALTTEVPTEWNVPYHEVEYEESISGYQNYVNEIERKMSSEDELHRQEISERNPAPLLPSARTNGYGYRNESEAGSKAGGRGGRKSLGGAEMPHNARRVSGRKGKIEVFEEKVMHDGPERTISLWRERVADSSRGGSRVDDEGRSVATNHVHRRMPSSQSLRRVVSDGPKGNGSAQGAHGGEAQIQKTAKATYERSEYMVTYRPNPLDGFLMPVLSRSESISTIPFATMESRPFSPEVMPKSPTSPTSPTRKRAHGRTSLDRSEFVMTYPQTPPQSGSTVSSPSPVVPKPTQRQSSSLSRKISGSMGTAATPADGAKATSTSPVELILASCEPSLLHIAPILSELGMQRMEHLRAIARLSEDTRNREVKEYALKRGVTVVEWAILLDKLRAL
ncbi:uncharacterized protein C8Q71DRAFT_343230 [Rhodofomes roseus]|uniref:Uncharacterized protein n=1 Tax=Rhodofomes roseus TaxID=34475 RepID=A0ABQ8KSF1_9APHY|nr:uncharacterized protein C8Q71DRAFT_343230 [Rhodofomes roseus]KAH9841672.1 hypothetical protein C8Q71DRAFT_343230 [Rhodofomes roseus]